MILKITTRLTLALAFCAITGVASANGQTTNLPLTNAPAATPPAVIPLANIVNQAQAVTTQLQTDQASLDPDTTLQDVTEQLPELNSQIDNQNAQDSQMLKATPSLGALQASQIAWQSISESLTTAQDDLSRRVEHLDNLLGELGQLDTTWKATRDAATKAKLPPESIQHIKDVCALIAQTTASVNAHQKPLYEMQNRVAAAFKSVQGSLDTIRKATETARAELFQRNRPPLWDPQAFIHPAAGVMYQEKASLGAQLVELQTYLTQKIGAVLVHLLLLALLVAAFYWSRKTIQARAKTEPALERAAHVLGLPLATGILFALLAAWFLYPDAPRLLRAIIGAVALVPAVVITRRLIDPANFPILYAAVIAYFVDQVRYVIMPAGIITRSLFILELLAVCIFILAALRFRSMAESLCETVRLKRLTRAYLHVTFFVLFFAGSANVFGYTQLSIVAGNGMLDSSYLAVVLYAGLRVLDALVLAALSVRPLSNLGMVRRHQQLIYANSTLVIRWAVFLVWLAMALSFFALLEPLWDKTGHILTKHYNWGYFDFQLGAVLAFPITVWAAFLLSRFIRFCLNEEIYPHMQLGRGIPYATSTVVHYTVLLIGFIVALDALGVDLSKFTILAGAFGVGLGFGLQNIMNNFISGLILLFERPIKVGDDIQIDANTMGKVERIGIRASIILLTNGSEMIVPNGNLISSPVTNWTLSNCERLIEIPVSVTSKVDPQHVLDLLTNAALANDHVIKNPAPQAFLLGFSGATLSFRLRAWIDSEEEWMKITSDVSLAINAALTAENIALG